ncbi:MAG: hypothetical protein IMW89_22160, partial [Ktedonobacteraceae bacterium]|nr:hypothetical protein [Ktedonobacteraceae bacterium]
MNQGNGTEILGAGDPRSTTIGIIYVSSVDDRKSVLTAILAQEELGRKQIAVVLPAQNKAFQRAQDFDILKHLPRKLRARLIIIAPAGSSPAELARRQRFTVYSTLENYANALRAEAEETGQARSDQDGLPKKIGWLFGSARFKTPASPAQGQGQQHGPIEPVSQTNAAQPPPASLPPLPPVPAPASHQAGFDASAAQGERNGHNGHTGRNLAVIAGAGVAGAGAGLIAADMMHDTQGFGQSPSALTAENQASQFDEQPPANAAAPASASQPVQPVQPGQPETGDAAASFYATQQMDDALPPVQPGDDETEQDDQVQQNAPAQRPGPASAIIASGTAGAVGAAAFSAGRGNENVAQPPQPAQAPGEQGPIPLELPVRRNTPIKLPPPAASGT